MLLGSSPIPRRTSWVPCALDGLKPGCLVGVDDCGEVVVCLCPSCCSVSADYKSKMIQGGGSKPTGPSCPWTEVPVAPPFNRRPHGPSYDWKSSMSDGAYTATMVPQGPRPSRPRPSRPRPTTPAVFTSRPPSRPPRPRPGTPPVFTSRPGRVGLLGTYGPNIRFLHGGPLVAGKYDDLPSAAAPRVRSRKRKRGLSALSGR